MRPFYRVLLLLSLLVIASGCAGGRGPSGRSISYAYSAVTAVVGVGILINSVVNCDQSCDPNLHINVNGTWGGAALLGTAAVITTLTYLFWNEPEPERGGSRASRRSAPSPPPPSPPSDDVITGPGLAPAPAPGEPVPAPVPAPQPRE